jgi:hypothetical protein
MTKHATNINHFKYLKGYKGHHIQPVGSSVVYWIHKPEHIDIFTEGYVGITNKQVSKRWYKHKLDAKEDGSLPVHRAINKYDDIIFEVILAADSREYCQEIEKKLRPSINIGWNVAQGGDIVNTYEGGLGNRRRNEWLNLNDPNTIDRLARGIAKRREQEANGYARRCNAYGKRVKLDMIRSVIPKGTHDPTKQHKARPNNKIGLRGICWHVSGRWHAQYKGKHLCYSKDIEVVKKAYEEAKLADYRNLLNNKNILGDGNEQARPQSFTKGVFKGGCL